MKRNAALYCALTVAFVVGVLLLVTPMRADSTITVTTTGDVIATDGLCSLREAIIAANTDEAFSDCPAGSGADTIEFSSQLPSPATIVLTSTGAGENNALTGDLDVAGRLTINGTGAGQTIIDGNDADRVFEILPTARVTISGVTIQHGNPGITENGGGVGVNLSAVLTLTHSSVISNTAMRGGGIQVLGRLSLSDSTIDANQGGGINSDGGLSTLNNVYVRRNGGPGIRNENIATLTFNGGTVSHNSSGGVYNSASNATLINVAVISNTGSGGVFSAGSGTIAARLTVNGCTILSNAATNGGGILSQGINARANIHNTDVSGNTATSDGGGVFNNGLMTLTGSTIRLNQARSGGGIGHFGGNLYMTNNTISGNTAGDNGGGLYNRNSAILTNVTLANNVAGEPETGPNIFVDTSLLSIRNSIVAYAAAEGNCFNSEGFLTSLGHNLEGGDTCGFNAAGDIINTDPLLGPLQDNGGDTPTRALMPGSPAIDAGDDAACPDTDQRGLPRPQGAACDIGAYEYGFEATTDLAISKTRLGSGSVVAGERITYTLTITNAGPTAPVTATVVDTWTPVNAVVGVDAPNCAVDLAGGVVTCTHTNLGMGSAVVPAPYLVFTTSAAFSGLLTNTASVSPVGGIGDLNPADNVSDPVVVTITPGGGFSLYLPLILR